LERDYNLRNLKPIFQNNWFIDVGERLQFEEFKTYRLPSCS